MEIDQKKIYSISDLRYLMERLRDPEIGCPWDRKQTYSSLIGHTLEEVYEVVDTIDRNDFEHLSEELGDLLFQIIFYSQIGAEEGHFDFDEVVSGITAKLIRRHPHVFPSETLDSSNLKVGESNSDSVNSEWEALKKQERLKKGISRGLDDIPMALPALNRALKLQKRAAQTGFDWSSIDSVLSKIDEEFSELKVEIDRANPQGIEDELGDLLFTCVNLSRHLQVDPETALRRSNAKFKRRFNTVESLVDGGDLSQYCLSELERLWIKAKDLD
jgi:ATP diphosphatase